MTAPLRVGINARLLTEPRIRGWNRYTINLLAELPASGVELVLYSRDPIHPCYLERLPAGSFRVVEERARNLPVWEHRFLPKRLAADRIDLFHSPFNFGIPWSAPCPTVLTLHDAIDFVYYRSKQSIAEKLSPSGLRFWAHHWVARKRADHIITVSRHAKSDLERVLGIRPSRISVVPEAADPIFLQPPSAVDRVRTRERFRLPERYVFYVGGWEERKNIPFLLRAFAFAGLPDVELVLAGGKSEEKERLLRLATELGIADRLRLLGWVEESDLPTLYSEALAFAYPSEYEGFGLQLCEAMALGTPCLAANATCLPETLGSGGECFGLENPVELAALIKRVADDPPFRNALRKRASERSAQLSWRATAEETVRVYRSLLG